jgi:hypothetical protein
MAGHVELPCGRTLQAATLAALEKDDGGLLNELHELLTPRAVGDPYATDGNFAAKISHLPPGLRAMASTHWLDISLTLDSITQLPHFEGATGGFHGSRETPR